MNKTTQCIKLAKRIRLNQQWQKLKSIKSIPSDYYTSKFTALPIALIVGTIRIIYRVLIDTAKLFSILVELPLIPKNRSFYTFWLLHGLDKDDFLISDKNHAYQKFSRENKVTHIGLKSGMPDKNNSAYHIQNINSYHSRLKGWMQRFNGVATRYLDHWISLKI